MTATTHLRGMTWDHPRGTGPVRAGTALWAQRHQEVSVTWDARPLSAFEDQPIPELAADYDLLMIDHPHVGSAVQQGALTAVEEWVESEFLRDHRLHATGPSVDSYLQDGRQWALAVDAASQVGAYRADLLEEVSAAPPNSWTDVADLAASTSASAARLVLPLNPTHAWCAVLSIARAQAGPGPCSAVEWQQKLGDALTTLSDMVSDLDPRSRDVDPIAAGELATRSDDVLGIPLAFGYVTFARPDPVSGRQLTYVDAPSGAAGIGSVLGGVGLALSARSAHLDLAASLATFIADPGFQRSGFVAAGGQPGHRSAWTDPQIDADSNAFFSSTLQSLDSAFVRPHVAGAERAQRQCADIVYQWLWHEATSTSACAQRLGRLVADLDTHQESA